MSKKRDLVKAKTQTIYIGESKKFRLFTVIDHKFKTCNGITVSTLHFELTPSSIADHYRMLSDEILNHLSDK